jgi:hypothetical protein
MTIKGMDPDAIAREGEKKVLRIFRRLKIRYMGVSIRDAGSICVTRKVSRKALLPGVLYRPMP